MANSNLETGTWRFMELFKNQKILKIEQGNTDDFPD